MKQRILVIEDDAFLASLILRALEKVDFDVKLALDGEEALEKIEKQIPDFILLDLILPGIDGFELLKKLKKSSRTKQIPVIILSNLGSQNEIKKGLKLGAEAYLIKANILPEEMVKKVKEILQQKY